MFQCEKSTTIKTDSNKKPVKSLEFEDVINDEVDEEPLTKCTICHRQFHKICVLYLDAVSPDG